MQAGNLVLQPRAEPLRGLPPRARWRDAGVPPRGGRGGGRCAERLRGGRRGGGRAGPGGQLPHLRRDSQRPRLRPLEPRVSRWPGRRGFGGCGLPCPARSHAGRERERSRGFPAAGGAPHPRRGGPHRGFPRSARDRHRPHACPQRRHRGLPHLSPRGLLRDRRSRRRPSAEAGGGRGAAGDGAGEDPRSGAGGTRPSPPAVR